MGWTFTHKTKGTSMKDFFCAEFSNSATSDDGHGVLDVACPNPREAYIAYRLKDGRVICIVCLLDYRHNDYCNFGYKDMDETMQPFYYNCPERIFKLLTPGAGNEEWRAEVQRRIASKVPSIRLKAGGIYEITAEILFAYGYRLAPGMLVMCRDTRRRSFEVVSRDSKGRMRRLGGETYCIQHKDKINASMRFTGELMP